MGYADAIDIKNYVIYLFFMDNYDASKVSMWSAVADSKKKTALSQLKSLSEIMDGNFSGVLFRNTLDYIFDHAFLAENGHIRYIKRDFRAILPRTECANILLGKNVYSKSRKEFKTEHIISVRTLGSYFINKEYLAVLENFNLCIVTNDEFDKLGRGCGFNRYSELGIKLIIPCQKMIRNT